MRSVWFLTAILATTILSTTVAIRAEDAASPAKQLPSDDAIIKLCGGTLADMFAKCGTPDTITVNGDKVAVLIYGPYGFTVNRDKVLGSYFFDDWKGTIRGVKYGDSKEQAVKVLGGTYKDIKGKDFEAYSWPVKDQKATIYLYFTDDKVSNVQITPND